MRGDRSRHRKCGHLDGWKFPPATDFWTRTRVQVSVRTQDRQHAGNIVYSRKPVFMRLLSLFIVGILGLTAFAGADEIQRTVSHAAQPNDAKFTCPSKEGPRQPVADAFSIPLGRLILRTTRARLVPIAAARLTGSAMCDRALQCCEWSYLTSRIAIAQFGTLQTSQIRLQV
jgi:hypothetical protein